jgi:hypothetical protein
VPKRATKEFTTGVLKTQNYNFVEKVPKKVHPKTLHDQLLSWKNYFVSFVKTFFR